MTKTHMGYLEDIIPGIASGFCAMVVIEKCICFLLHCNTKTGFYKI